MSTLILDLPDQQFARLERVARSRGVSVQELVTELIGDVAGEQDPGTDYPIQDDPLFNMQAHDSHAPSDLSQASDHYLYGAQDQ